MTERKYVMTRLAAGDYLLPSNDGATLWRIYTYEEEGSLETEVSPGVTREIRGTFWGCARKPMPTQGFIEDLGWEGWEVWSDLHRSRAAAVADALKAVSR